tara:strand:- start:3138 stop:3941 length:804 start_codon:yes stop_codon:yes gene_type:complete
MAIQIHDERQPNEQANNEPLLDAEGQLNAAPEDTLETPQEEDNTPEKYRGKTVAEVISMHQEAEKQLGRQSSEVGDLRKVVDTYIADRTQLNTPAPTQEPEEEVDFFTDPDKAVARAIDSHPDIVKARETTANNLKQQSLDAIQKAHPDMNDLVVDPAFGEWIMKSKVRQKLFAQADQNFDYDAADELFSNWKEKKANSATAAKSEGVQRKETLKAASTGNARGSSESTSKKIYRRSDIIKLMRTDPDRYNAMASEITSAYAEGRVR